MKRNVVIGGLVTTAFVLNLQILPGGFFANSARTVNISRTVEQIRVGRLSNLSVKDEKETVITVKNIVV